MTNNYSQTLTEVSCILKNMPNEDIKKLPKKLIESIEQNKDKNYDFKIDETLPMEKQKMKRETIVYMTMLYYNYWCKTQEEKDNLKEKLKLNEKNHEQFMAEKYSYDKIFKNKERLNSEEEIKEEQIQTKDIIIIQEKWYKKIINKILEFFRRKR